jgi:choline dehydrogenase
VIGGSTALNAMYYVRPSQQEVNAWHDLIAPANSSAAAVWAPDSFFAAIKNTETFTPPSTDIESQVGIKYSQGSRGNLGKLQTSYPG